MAASSTSSPLYAQVRRKNKSYRCSLFVVSKMYRSSGERSGSKSMTVLLLHSRFTILLYQGKESGCRSIWVAMVAKVNYTEETGCSCIRIVMVATEIRFCGPCLSST